MKIPLMIRTILRNGFENTSAGPVITVWTGVNSTLSHRVSSRMKCAPRCWVTQKNTSFPDVNRIVINPSVSINRIAYFFRLPLISEDWIELVICFICELIPID